jgi:hypothetical protein
MHARNGDMPATISTREAAASAQNTMMVANGRPSLCTTNPPNGIDIMPTHRAILVNAPALAMLKPPPAARNEGTKLK